MGAMAAQISSLTIVYFRIFRHRSKKTSKLRVTGLCAGNSPLTGAFLTPRASNAEIFPFDDVIMYFSDRSMHEYTLNRLWRLSVNRKLWQPFPCFECLIFPVHFLHSIKIIPDSWDRYISYPRDYQVIPLPSNGSCAGQGRNLIVSV